MSARRLAAGAAAMALLLLAGGPSASRGDGARAGLPADPLRIAWGLSGGMLVLDDEDYRDFFDRDALPMWTLRGDLRVWKSLRLGAAFSAGDKSTRGRTVTVGSDHYPIQFRFSAAQTLGELYLRLELPALGRWRPHLSAGGLLSEIHAECQGYSAGYEAIWEEYRPAAEVRQRSTGWRGAIGVQTIVWANVSLLVEASRLELESYGAPVDRDPPVGRWDHGGWRIETGFLQRF